MISFFRRSPRLANLAVLTVSLALFMVLLEGTLRVFDIGYSTSPTVYDQTIHHRHPTDFRFRRKDIGWGEYGGFQVQYDSQGLVTDPDGKIKQDLRRQARTVAMMGDSMVQGGEVPYGDGFVALLNRRADPDVFVVNWGVGSYSPVLYRIQWMRQVAKTKPSLVVLMLYSNDTDDDRVYMQTATLDAAGLPISVAGPPDTGVVGVLRSLYVLRLVNAGWRTLDFALFTKQADRAPTMGPTGGFIEEAPEITPITDRVLRGLIGQIEASGARFAISAVPSKYVIMSGDTSKADRQFAANVKRWAQAAHVDYIDLWPTFETYMAQRKEANPKPFYVHDIHVNETGNRLIAEAIAKHFPGYFRQK